MAFLKMIKSSVVETMKTAKKVGEDDPRRIVHAVKVGFALTIVSMFYYFRPLYDGFGQAGMWAILTVVVVFEYTVGGTLSKSLNRGFATLVAGGLGIGAEYLANLCGKKGEPVVLGLFVFLLAAASTFTRFFPNVKRRYDYGVLIFILTFTMVAVSGFRVTEILQLAHQRLSTIVIGGVTCMMTSMFIYPVWAGQDLHNLVAGNIEKLAAFLEGFGSELAVIFPGDEIRKTTTNEDKSFLQSYKSVINSKANEESLANFAWWEPPHGRFRYGHPWIQYLKIGGLVRDCACLIEALNGYTNDKSQAKVTSELQVKIQETCIKMSSESGKALRELAAAIKKMSFPSRAAITHAQNSITATHDLKNILQSSSTSTKADLQSVMPLLVIASVMMDITGFVEKISVSVNDLSQQACFRNAIKSKQLHRGIVKPVDDECVVIEVRGGDEESGQPKKKDYVPPE